MPLFNESCQLFEWSYNTVYAEWAALPGAQQYTVAYSDNVAVTTRETSYTIPGLQRAQPYSITVTALSADNSDINSFTCSGETGED